MGADTTPTWEDRSVHLGSQVWVFKDGRKKTMSRWRNSNKVREPSEWAAVMTSGTPPLVAKNMGSQSPPRACQARGVLLSPLYPRYTSL